MEGCVYQRIKLALILREFPFSSRYKTGGQKLVRTLSARGLLVPVTAVEKAGRYVIVSGESRFLAALQLGWDEMPAYLLPPHLEDKDLFLISVLSNWNERISELDAVFALSRALQLQISEEVIFEEVLPALGLPAEKRWIAEAREISSLDSSLIEAVGQGRLPYRGIRTLSVFSLLDQKYFAEEIATRLTLTSNQLLNIVQWLSDLTKKNKVSLRSLLEAPPFSDLLKPAAPGRDLRQITERFFEAVRAVRYPRQTEMEAKFRDAAAALSAGQKLKNGFWVEAPTQFEEPGIRLHAHLRDAKSLEKLQQALEKHRNLVNSLFDIVL